VRGHIVCAFLVAGCGSSSGTSRLAADGGDAGANAADVASVEDVRTDGVGSPPAGDASAETSASEAGSTDSAAESASGFCAGTPIAGSCLAAFFAQAAPCFHPSGACVDQTASAGTNVCWADGARLTLTTGTQGAGFNYFSGSNLCFYGSWTTLNGNQKDYTFTFGGSALLVYNRTTGETTCLDGTRAQLAPDFGGCGAITAIVDLTMNGCSAGTCP
jgi:hypothetical protein